MRIGILTLPLHTNYGGILQAYALQTVLERIGHDVVVFQNDYIGIKYLPTCKMPIIWLKRLLRKCIVNRNIVVFLEQKRKRDYPVLSQNTSRFIQKYIHTFYVKILSDIPFKDFDAIVVGSDQVWRPAYVRKMWNTDIQDAFLRFAKDGNIKRIAYAVSFGVETWDYSQTETRECKQLASMFGSISVRESSGIAICSNYLGVEARQVLDPTLLLPSKDYEKVIGNSQVIENTHTLFYYILDETNDKIELIKRIAEDRRLRISGISIIRKELIKFKENKPIPSIEEWLQGFRNASFIVTDSFHGCVFSIIFRKPFIAIGNKERGMSRFNSLLNMFGMQKCLLNSINDYSSCNNYDLPEDLEDKLLLLKDESMKFLLSSLN